MMNSCVGQRTALKKSDKSYTEAMSGNFIITKIDSSALYYFIYVSKDQVLRKIISKKENIQNDLTRIKLGKTYFFNLNDFIYRDSDNPLTGFISMDFCYSLDDDTLVCPEDGVWGIYRTENLKGLIYQKN